MALHLLKLCVGVEDIDHLRRLQAARLVDRDGRPMAPGYTRRMPRQRDEVLDGGSIYWIVRGVIRVRQRILDMETEMDQEGQPFCRFYFDPELVETNPVPHRAIQGWRYLPPERAPADLRPAGEEDDGLPAGLEQELRELGIF